MENNIPSPKQSFIRQLLRGQKEFLSTLLAGEKMANRYLIKMLPLAVIGTAAYGLAMSTSLNQLSFWELAQKMITLLFISTILATPSLYIFSIIRGASFSWRQLLFLLTGQLTVAAIVLVSFLPIIWFFLLTADTLHFISVINVILIGFSLLLGISFLEKGFRAQFNLLNNGNKKIKSGLDVLLIWAIIYAAVLIQMGIFLKPFFI